MPVARRRVSEAMAGLEKDRGAWLSGSAVDASKHELGGGGEGTGKDPTDPVKLGWEWAMSR